jgi:hypothetical protein
MAKTPPLPVYPKWTHAKFWGFIRSALRSASQKWPPKQESKKQSRRPYKGTNIRQKWEYKCSKCGGWFSDKECEQNHKVPVGELRDFNDLPMFVQRLFCGVEGFETVCKKCHKELTNKQRSKWLNVTEFPK